MIREIRLDTMEKVQQLAFEQTVNPDNHRLRSSYFYPKSRTIQTRIKFIRAA